jgi:hypothetical protein
MRHRLAGTSHGRRDTNGSNKTAADRKRKPEKAQIATRSCSRFHPGSTASSRGYVALRHRRLPVTVFGAASLPPSRLADPAQATGAGIQMGRIRLRRTVSGNRRRRRLRLEAVRTYVTAAYPSPYSAQQAYHPPASPIPPTLGYPSPFAGTSHGRRDTNGSNKTAADRKRKPEKAQIAARSMSPYVTAAYPSPYSAQQAYHPPASPIPPTLGYPSPAA